MDGAGDEDDVRIEIHGPQATQLIPESMRQRLRAQGFTRCLGHARRETGLSTCPGGRSEVAGWSASSCETRTRARKYQTPDGQGVD